MLAASGLPSRSAPRAELPSTLVPAGVVAATGEFDAGDAVELEDLDGEVFAKGIVRYDVETLRQNVGRRTTELPEGVSHEVVHADDLVVLP